VVALKTLNATLAADALARTRFQGEVKSARRVSHPNVCRIFDFGVHGEGDQATYFLTMELLAGETLETRLRRGRLPFPEVLEVMQQVAAAVDAAHEMGVVHRDLKPSNVMLVQSSGGGIRAVVTDFGIARRLNEATVTRDGWVGTPAYIAPEQLEGKKVDATADVYTFGVMLFELATGKLPFQGSSGVEVAMQRLAREAPRAREVDATVPEAWDEAIARCLSRSPGERWLKATDALAAMGAEAPRSRRPPSRSSRRAPVALGALVLAVAIAGVAWWKSRSVLPSADRVVTVQVEMAAGTPELVMPEGFPPFNAAVAYVVQKQWR
jgi:serine/threonine protein kinase